MTQIQIVLAALLAAAVTACGGGSEPTIDISGQWSTDYGKATFAVDGNQVTGPYDWGAGSRFVGELDGSVLTGYWLQTSSIAECEEERDGTRYYGRIHFAFTEDAFIGTFSYCEGDPVGDSDGSWNGERITAEE